MKLWNYLSNSFLITTDNSYRQCRKIGDYTVNALNVQRPNPLFQALYNSLSPVVNNFNRSYEVWLAQLGTQKSKTNQLTVELKSLQSELIERWDILVQVQYPQNSSEYIALLPHRRIPFQTGSQEDRISALNAFELLIRNNPVLAPIWVEVSAFQSKLIASFNLQKSHLNATLVDSSDVEAKRIEVCVELYSILGQLMSHYKSSPLEVGNFFDLESIRNHEQTVFKHSLKGAEIYLAMTHSFQSGEELRLVNRGGTALRFALCADVHTSIGSSYVEVRPSEELISQVESLGDINHRFLKVQNMSASEGGKYTIMLL